MSTFTIIHAPSAATAKLADRLARQGSSVRSATDGGDVAGLLASPTDVLILTSAAPSGSGADWALGLKTVPVLSSTDLPDVIDAKLVIIDVPGAAHIEATIRARLPKGSVIVRSGHTSGRKEFLADSALLLPEFVTAAYDKFKPETEDLARVWVEVEDAAIKSAGGAMTRRREPLRYARTLVG